MPRPSRAFDAFGKYPQDQQHQVRWGYSWLLLWCRPPVKSIERSHTPSLFSASILPWECMSVVGTWGDTSANCPRFKVKAVAVPYDKGHLFCCAGPSLPAEFHRGQERMPVILETERFPRCTAFVLTTHKACTRKRLCKVAGIPLPHVQRTNCKWRMSL